MSRQERRSFAAAQQWQAVLPIIRGEGAGAAQARRLQRRETPLDKWREQAQEGLRSAWTTGGPPTRERALAQQVAELERGGPPSHCAGGAKPATPHLVADAVRAAWQGAQGRLSQQRVCALVGISRPMLWRWQRQEPTGERAPASRPSVSTGWREAARRRCRQLPSDGYRRITVYLQRQGQAVGPHRVRRWMRAAGDAQTGGIRAPGRPGGKKPAAPPGLQPPPGLAGMRCTTGGGRVPPGPVPTSSGLTASPLGSRAPHEVDRAARQAALALRNAV